MAKLYVAYGSNLNKEQMKDRCPGAEFVGTGSIENYELQFKGSLHGAHATIAPKEGSSVPVGMWTIKKRDESRLDMYEGYNLKGYCYYNKEQIPVKMDDGSTITGMVYIMDLSLNAFDFVMTVQACNICLQVFFAIGVTFLLNKCGKLKKVDLISLNRFGI